MPIFIFLLLIALTPVLHAHDIGVTEIKFIEQTNNTYYLERPKLGMSTPEVATPVFPEDCQSINHLEPQLPPGFYFSCSRALTTQDSIVLLWQREMVLVTATWQNNAPTKHLFFRDGETITLSLSALNAQSQNTSQQAQHYITLGIEHILTGIDHLAFVLGLLLLLQHRWSLIKAITAFTLAHSFTLALSVLQWISLPSAPVETCIALSIILLAYEILRAQTPHYSSITLQSPWLVAGLFGLLHGLGFAGALQSIGLPQAEIPVALVCFNLGVEIGQLLFICAILGLSYGYKRIAAGRIQQPWSIYTAYLLGGVSTYWCMQRLLTGIIAP